MVIYNVKSIRIKRWGTNCSFPFGQGSWWQHVWCAHYKNFEQSWIAMNNNLQTSTILPGLSIIYPSWKCFDFLVYFSEGWLIFCFSWIHLWFSTNHNGTVRKGVTKAHCIICKTRIKGSNFWFFFFATDVNLYFTSWAVILAFLHRRSYISATLCVQQSLYLMAPIELIFSMHER